MWPKEVLDFGAEPSIVPFEAHRAELPPEPDDPLARPQPLRRPRARAKSR
jgi:hypothetical protein